MISTTTGCPSPYFNALLRRFRRTRSAQIGSAQTKVEAPPDTTTSSGLRPSAAQTQVVSLSIHSLAEKLQGLLLNSPDSNWLYWSASVMICWIRSTEPWRF